jgi:hypothetical protein
MDIQARDDDKLYTDGYIISFNIVADEHIVSNQSISIIPTCSESINLRLNSIIFNNIIAKDGMFRVCDITTYKHGDYIQEGNVLDDPNSLLEIKFKTPFYDWFLDSIL